MRCVCVCVCVCGVCVRVCVRVCSVSAGSVKVWDPRVEEPVAEMMPADGQTARDCWAVAFGGCHVFFCSFFQFLLSSHVTLFIYFLIYYLHFFFLSSSGNAFNADERCVTAGYDNGDLKMFDLRTMSLLWETKLDNGVRTECFD